MLKQIILENIETLLVPRMYKYTINIIMKHKPPQV